jgi:hypothetical protein
VLVTTDMDVPEFEQKTVELADGTGHHRRLRVHGQSPFRDRSGRCRSVPDPDDFSIGERGWEESARKSASIPTFPSRPTWNSCGFSAPPAMGQSGRPPHLRARRRTHFLLRHRHIATATAMIGIYGAQSPLEVAAPGGIQTVEWAGAGEKLYLTGPATLIANGEAW